MAPQKSMVISQQQQPAAPEKPQAAAATKQQQQQAKKRKAKQQQQQLAPNQMVLGEQQAPNNNTNKHPSAAATATDGHQLKGAAQAQQQPTTKAATATSSPAPPVVPSERTSLKGNDNNGGVNKQQVPTSVVKAADKASNGTTNGNSSPATKEGAKRAVLVAVQQQQQQQQPAIVKQLSGEEADDGIDAGIELDGSSNSGSSVKDMNDDQAMKSNSASPVMAAPQPAVTTVASPGPNEQTDAVVVAGEDKSAATTCVAQEPVQQLAATTATINGTGQAPASSLCSPAPKKASSTTKQQLAANQSVIDADEQLLQERLEQKQRKCQQQPVSDNGKSSQQQSSEEAKGGKSTEDKTNEINKSTSSGHVPYRRKFSSQASLESQDGSLCKVCEQHVYQMERLLAEKSIYHKKCFRCHNCKIQLRIDNYSSHEGHVYCKAHHRQLFQPQVKLDSEDDVDIVAKSTKSNRRLSPHPNYLEIRKRQMIICENEPAELPKDVVRSDTKLDDGIEQLNLNLNNILEKFERGQANNSAGEESQPSSAGVVIEKPSFNIKKTLMAFESRLVNNKSNDDDDSDDAAERSAKQEARSERPVVRKLTNLEGLFNRQNSGDQEDQAKREQPVRPTPVRRSDSLMQRLKKYESRIAGEQVDDDDDDNDDEESGGDEDEDENNNQHGDSSKSNGVVSCNNRRSGKRANSYKPKKITSIDLSSLKNQWENGDINKRRLDDDDDDVDASERASKNQDSNNNIDGHKFPSQSVRSLVGDIDKFNNGHSVLSTEKEEELCRIREQLAQKKMGNSNLSVRNIYENAIREAQLQQQQQQASTRRESSDLSALNGFSTTGIQKQLLQQNGNLSNSSNQTPTTPTKEHFQLNFNNKANKLKEKFELGLITNSSLDDSDVSDNGCELTQLEKIRQEKLEDLSVFTDGEIKAREARSLFQKIDAAASGKAPKVTNSRSLASIGASMRAKLTSQMNNNNSGNNNSASTTATPTGTQPQKQQPIRLTNNVKM